jgi:hypothetical protein
MRGETIDAICFDGWDQDDEKSDNINESENERLAYGHYATLRARGPAREVREGGKEGVSEARRL